MAEFLTARDESDALAKQLRLLALWKFSFQDAVPDFIAETFKHLGTQASEPETYKMLATVEEAKLAKLPGVPAIDARLRPYRRSNDVQKDSADGLAPGTLADIPKYRDECEPLFRNALREWALAGKALDVSSASLIIAILGEISGPDFADELEIIDWDDETIFWHVQWALTGRGAASGAGPGTLPESG